MIRYCCKTDIGKVRNSNQDKADIFFNDGNIYLVVLDGMGGHLAGEKAASLALETFKNCIYKSKDPRSLIEFNNGILKALRKANEEVNLVGTTSLDSRDMGTTIIVAGLYKADLHKDKIEMYNVGDSRLYGYRDGKLEQLSEDQTYVQFLLRTGRITKEEMKDNVNKHILMNALGTFPTLSLEKKTFDNNYAKLLLCTDGLYNMLDDKTIKKVLEEEYLGVEEKVQKLIDLANEAGGQDNIGICLLEYNYEDEEDDLL